MQSRGMRSRGRDPDIEYVSGWRALALDACNRLIATEWCSRFRRHISHYGKWRARIVEWLRERDFGGMGNERVVDGDSGGNKGKESRGDAEESREDRIITLSFIGDSPLIRSFPFNSIFLVFLSVCGHWMSLGQRLLRPPENILLHTHINLE